MRIIVDSCSLILLAKSTILEELSKQYKLAITNHVYKEVVKGKHNKFLDALITERLYKEKKIEKVDIKNKNLLNKIKKDFGLGNGEASTLAFSIETGESILTDNKQGRKTAKVYGLKLIGSPEIIVALYKLEKIDKNKAVESLKSLKQFGWFEEYIIEEAIKEVQNGKD